MVELDPSQGEFEPRATKTALAFPGQGRQEAGICMDVLSDPQRFPQANDLFIYGNALINETLNDDPSKPERKIDSRQICESNPDEILNEDSEIAQALLTLSYLVRYQARQEMYPNDPEPDVITAHSLGKIAALAIAGSITFGDAMKLSVMRGRFTKEAAGNNPGTMGYVNDIDPAIIGELCQQYMEAYLGTFVGISSENNQRQNVISGTVEGVKEVLRRAKEELKARYAELLPIPYPSHCPMMEQARVATVSYLAEMDIKVADKTLVFNGIVIRPEDGQDGVETIRKMLADELVQKVSWTETDRLMRDPNILGVTKLLEIGATNKGTLATNTNALNKMPDEFYVINQIEATFFDPEFEAAA